MLTCCSGRCSSRTSTMIVAIISAIHFIIETVTIVFVHDHRLVLSPESGIFYSIAGTQITMTIFSVLLFAGAYVRIIWMCFPWLILAVLNIIYHIYVIFVLTMKTISDTDATKLEMIILLIFSTMVLVYMSSIVVEFIKDIRAGKEDDRRDEEDSFPLMGK